MVVDQVGKDVFGRDDDLEKMISFIKTGDGELFNDNLSEGKHSTLWLILCMDPTYLDFIIFNCG